MKQVFLHKGNIAVHEVSTPLMDDHSVLVRVHYSYISSGTEGATVAASHQSLIKKFVSNASINSGKIMGAVKEHGLASTFALMQEKMHKQLPLGYSCSGQVIAVGARVEGIHSGDYVVCAGAGFAHHAELVAVPKQLLVVVKDKTKLKQASITTIGAIALQGVRRAQLEIGNVVCVIGLGLIGQLTVQLAKRAGCIVYGVDIRQDRLELAKQYGADICFNPLTDDVIREVLFATSHYGVDATIITAASETGYILQQAMHCTRRKGKVVLVGDVKLEFDREPFYSKEIDLLISCSYGPGRYDAAYEREGKDYPYAYVRWTEQRNMAHILNLIETGGLQIDPLITDEYPLHNAAQGYAHLQKTGALGIVLKYRPEVPLIDEPMEIVDVKVFKPISGTVAVGMVGVGGFAKVKLLPMLAGMKNIKIHSIVDADAANALTIAKQYRAQRIGSDVRKVASDEDVQAVVIATPHAKHESQVLMCLSGGKAVLVEKPLAVTFEQYHTLKLFVQNNPAARLAVDFNRSFAPFMQEIKKAIRHRSNPLMLTYRMNGNYLPKDHWIQTDEHRGRIIGEACHIFELFCFLTDASPSIIQVAPLRHHSPDMPIADNFIAIITFDDGSICSLLYTALGNAGVGKEYMEIYFDGKTIVMDDYKELKGFGLPITFNKKSSTQDKGHDILFERFFESLAEEGNPHAPALKRALQATEISLIIDKLARQGGGFEAVPY